MAKVNGVEIKQSDLKAAEEDIGQQLPPLSEDAKRDYLITYVGDMMLVPKAAEGQEARRHAPSSSRSSRSPAPSC